MKTTRILAFMLACFVLAGACVFSVSAEPITFKPVTKNDKIYGIPAGTTCRQLNNAYYNTIISVYDLDGNHIALSSQKPIGTGFTIKIANVSYIAVVMGDVDGDGQIKANDYIKAKRAYLGTGAALSSLSKAALGIENDGELRVIHYVKLKRACLKTYDMNSAYNCAPYDPGASESGWTPGWV